jgi:sulfoxide reductase heme-binding subunit YedZ
MSIAYKPVQWNRHKKVYDGLVVAGIVLFVAVFVAAGKAAWRGVNSIGDEVLILRALGVCGVGLLHIILCIGPLARLDPRFSALLYNRRHLGVCTFLVALAHAAVATGYYGGFGVRSPVSALLADSGSFASVSGFPFEVLGLVTLLILFVMAATSHDFWLKNLGPVVWKRLHMLVYGAYGSVVLHVALGSLQSERHPAPAAVLGLGVLVVSVLHIVAGRREAQRDASAVAPVSWVDVASVDEIPMDRAKVVCLQGRERVALFRHERGISAISNVCAHQGGPIGEGKIVGGCVTCPWHGYQYLAENGQSPPPFTEKLPTYQVRIQGARVLLNPEPLVPGTHVEPARPEAGKGAGGA